MQEINEEIIAATQPEIPVGDENHMVLRTENLCGNGESVLLDTAVNDVTKLLGCCNEHDLKIKELFRVASVNVSEILRDLSVEDETAESSVDDL